MKSVEIILYVSDQQASRKFYETVLEQAPSLDVPGMTEFRMTEGAMLGLMPITTIRELLGASLPDPMAAQGVPRSELYLQVNEPEAYHRRALEQGARELSPLVRRSWGHEAAYSLDPDGHVLVFARDTARASSSDALEDG
jgi:uncharacterized protein